MIRLQKTYSINIIKLYDLFVMEDEDILVLEYPRHYMSLHGFYENNICGTTENQARLIIRQLIAILKHCMDCGVYTEMRMDNVLIHPHSLQVKLMDFRGSLITEGRRELAF